MKARFQALKALLGESRMSSRGSLTTGIAVIDQILPGGGLATGRLHEIWDGGTSGFAVAPALWVAGLLAARPGPVVWCARDGDLYGPGLAAVGFPPERLMIVRSRQDQESLWVMEEALRHGGLAAVIGEIGVLDLTASRRLQLAAEKTGSIAFVLRRPRYQREQRNMPAAVETRWRIRSAPSVALPLPVPGAARWRLELLRARNGRSGNWLIGWNHETLSFCLSSGLAAGPAAVEGQAEHIPAPVAERPRRLAAG